MFHAARAALMTVGAPVEACNAKTHRGLQSAVNQYLVKSGILPKECGASLRRAEEFRLFGDCSSEQVSHGDADRMLQLAEKFVDAVAKLMQSYTSGP